MPPPPGLQDSTLSFGGPEAQHHQLGPCPTSRQPELEAWGFFQPQIKPAIEKAAEAASYCQQRSHSPNGLCHWCLAVNSCLTLDFFLKTGDQVQRTRLIVVLDPWRSLRRPALVRRATGTIYNQSSCPIGDPTAMTPLSHTTVPYVPGAVSDSLPLLLVKLPLDKLPWHSD